MLQLLGQKPSESETTSLFCRALYNLGVCAADWEIWYGTRPLAIHGAQRRPAPIQHPAHPSANH